MSKATLPIVTCDYEGGCDEWELDHYEMAVSTIDGVRVGPVPLGWSGQPGTDEHLCPEHSPEVPF